jgi:acetoin utilization deacetylase AcuC-like enzyme
MISAGFDAHTKDPLANLNWETDDYHKITELLSKLAKTTCDGKIVSCLEGGYNLNALQDSVAAHVKALMEA